MYLFFKQKTAYEMRISDWSSDVCSSDLATVTIRGALVQMGPHKIDRARWDWDEVERNPFGTPDATAAAQWEDYLDGVRKAGSSAGAVIEVGWEERRVGKGWVRTCRSGWSPSH